METGKGRLRRSRVPALLLLLAAVLSLPAILVGINQWNRVSEVQGGARAVGTFHSEGSNCFRHRCWVDFEIDGRRVEADLPALTSSRNNKVPRDGKPIVIRYLASDPTTVAEEDGYGFVVATVFLLGIPTLALLLAGVLRLVFGPPRRDPAPQG
ncbi:hypothetical protein OHT57_30080 [Streptomyces sp. NBC_00285]|uniref:hypothetical protein n=1 Tax=Streptomyces sp. NBC_00285 TaxID=2975700 RepID=UPI002E2BB342|nr:hypothetical protein [Streptomyces sp. NBC_00285]